VVAVGASAGGVEALTDLAAGMPPDLPCAVLVVLHIPPGSQSVLARILDRSGPLTAVAAADHAPLREGIIYVAEPNKHLLVRDGHVVLSDGPTENGHRPAINTLTDYEVTAAEIGNLLAALAKRDFEEPTMERDAKPELENRIAMARRFSTRFDAEALGPPPGDVCPDCHGFLQEVSEGNYRCRIGHAWSADALLLARDEEVGSALWVTVRSLREKCRPARRMADTVGSGRLYKKYSAIADEAQAYREGVRGAC
jgi:two-component system, chemotaxis family, protein-glutamate methylesterase/glutaminase